MSKYFTDLINNGHLVYMTSTLRCFTDMTLWPIRQSLQRLSRLLEIIEADLKNNQQNDLATIEKFNMHTSYKGFRESVDYHYTLQYQLVDDRHNSITELLKEVSELLDQALVLQCREINTVQSLINRSQEQWFIEKVDRYNALIDNNRKWITVKLNQIKNPRIDFRKNLTFDEFVEQVIDRN